MKNVLEDISEQTFQDIELIIIDDHSIDATEEVILVPTTPTIIDSNNYPVKPMTAEEAVLRLNDEENQFLVFRNADNERFSVIYKRKDGNYGLIQP